MKKLFTFILACVAYVAAVNAEPITVRLDASSAWNSSSVNLYAWDENGNPTLADWPGISLVPDDAGWFSYTFDESVSNVNFIWYYNGYQTYELTDITESVCMALTGYLWNNPTSYDFVSCPAPEVYREITVSALSDKSAIHMAIGDENLEQVTSLKVIGTINSYDIMIIRNKMSNLRVLDLSEANIVANKYEYYTGQPSVDNVLTEHAFDNTQIRVAKLPASLVRIEANTFNKDVIREVEISSGTIGAQAFTMCTQLQKVILGNCDTIGRAAFARCESLQNIELPSTLKVIDELAFYGTGLTSVTIPASVNTIGMFAFAGSDEAYINNIHRDYSCYHVLHPVEQYDEYISFNGNTYYANNVIIQPNQDYIEVYGSLYPTKYKASYYDDSGSWHEGWYYYYNGSEWVYYSSWGNIVRFIKVDDQLMEIETIRVDWDQICYYPTPSNDCYYIYDTYQYRRANGNLRSVIFDSGSALTELSRSVFDGNNRLTEFVFPENLRWIGNKALAGCAIDSVVIPQSVFYIDNFAFTGSTSRHIVLPEGLEEINPYAFYDCQNLEEVKVTSSIRNIGDYAFDQCPNVKGVYTYTVEPTQINQNTFSCWKNADLHVPSTSYYTYFYNTQWSQFLSIKTFDEEYDYFYVNNDYELGGDNGTIDGTPDADLNENSGLIVTGDTEQQVGTITISGDENGAASIIACEENLTAENLVIRLETKKGSWNYFCFPFELLLSQLGFDYPFAIRQYDGATRAEYGAGGWINMIGDVLQKGLGYIFQGAQSGILEITIPNPKFGCEDYEQIVHAFNSVDAVNANWNFIGNPFPSWFDLNALFEHGFSSPVYIWDGSDYRVYRPGDDEYHFHPYEGFFTQNPNGEDMHITWGSDGRETKSQVDNKLYGSQAPARAAARKVNQQDAQRKLINLQLAADGNKHSTRIVFNDAAQMDYELGRDAVLMDGGKSPIHLWSINNERRLSINERPYATGEVELGYEVANDGVYTLSATRMDAEVIIYDNELQQEVDLSQGDYTFSTEAGVNTTRFAIRRLKGEDQSITAIDEATIAEEKVNVYTLLGVKLLDNVRRDEISLSTGIYVVESKNGTRTEITVK